MATNETTVPLKILGNKILFQFEDEVKNGKFYEKSQSNILLGTSHETSSKLGRVVRVFAVGPDVKDVKVGDRIVVDNLRWTEAFKITQDGEKFWQTNENEVLCIIENE